MGKRLGRAFRMLVLAGSVLAVCTGGKNSFNKYFAGGSRESQEIKWEFSDFFDYDPSSSGNVEVTDRRALLALNEGLDTHSMKKYGDVLFYKDKRRFQLDVLYDAKRLGYDAERIEGLSVKESALLACKLTAERLEPGDNPVYVFIRGLIDERMKVDELYNGWGGKSCVGYSKVAKGIMMHVLKPRNAGLENVFVSCYGSDSPKFVPLRYHIYNQIVDVSSQDGSLVFDTAFFDAQKYDQNNGKSANGYLELLMGKDFGGLMSDVREFERGRKIN